MMKTTVHSRLARFSRQCLFLLWIGIIVVMSPDRLVCAQEPTENSLVIRTEENYFSAYINGQMALRYKYKQVPFKPYVQELYTPSGLNILLDSPSDHVHHRGVMFAVGVDNISFWEELVLPANRFTKKTSTFQPFRMRISCGEHSRTLLTGSIHRQTSCY